MATTLLMTSTLAQASLDQCCTYMESRLGSQMKCMDTFQLPNYIGNEIRRYTKSSLTVTSKPEKLPYAGMNKTSKRNGAYIISKTRNSGTSFQLASLTVSNKQNGYSCAGVLDRDLEEAIEVMGSAYTNDRNTSCSVHIQDLDSILSRKLKKSFENKMKKDHNVTIVDDSRKAGVIVMDLPLIPSRPDRAISYHRTHDGASTTYDFSASLKYADTFNYEQITFNTTYNTRNVKDFSHMDYSVLTHIVKNYINKVKCANARR